MTNPTSAYGISGRLNSKANACDSVRVLRQRYRAACKDLRRAGRAVQGCLNPRRLPVLNEQLERARLHLEEVETEVKKSWSSNESFGEKK